MKEKHEDRREVCGRCAWHKPGTDSGGNKEWVCHCYASINYGAPTRYEEGCAEFEKWESRLYRG